MSDNLLILIQLEVKEIGFVQFQCNIAMQQLHLKLHFIYLLTVNASRLATKYRREHHC